MGDMKFAPHDLDVARCKTACYSDVTCGVWQYGMGGCWREHKTHKATSTDTHSDFAKNVSAGEYILHYCPPLPPKKDDGSSVPLLWIILAIIGGLLLFFGILYVILHKPKAPKKTRAIKIANEYEEAVVPLFVPQPTVLVRQPSVVYSAPAPTTSVVYTQVAQPTYTTSVAAPTVQTAYMAQPTVVSEAVAVEQPLLGETVVVGQ